MSDLVERLRDQYRRDAMEDRYAAADEIERLRAALREIDDKANPIRPGVDGDALMAIGEAGEVVTWLRHMASGNAAFWTMDHFTRAADLIIRQQQELERQDLFIAAQESDIDRQQQEIERLKQEAIDEIGEVGA